MREDFLKRIERKPVVCDGAMGTMLYTRGIPYSQCFDALNLTQPQVVKDVHLGYVKAGAELLETNTFGANRIRLAMHGLEGQVKQINQAGVRLARELAGEELYVAGAVGPLGIRLEPLGSTSLKEARQMFREQMEALVEAGADVILIETMVDLNEARQALAAAREVCSLPVIVQMTVQEDGNTPLGTAPEDFTRALDEDGADLIGLNCSVGPAGVLQVLERMVRVTGKKLSAQPNAGLPRIVGGRSLYLCSPDYMGEYARRFIENGVRLVGGCCGTTPEHIRAIKSAVRSLAPSASRRETMVSSGGISTYEPVTVEKRSRFAALLASREFPVVVEMLPPRGCDTAREFEGARYLSEMAVDAVNIPDRIGGTARMSPQMLAVAIALAKKPEVLLHYSCRSRNVLTIQSDLLGLHALGLRNIVAVTGQPPSGVEYPEATTVFDVDSIGLVNILAHLNRGLDAAGNPLGAQTSFLIGVTANPDALNMEEEIRRFQYKVEAGANFAITSPVFDVQKLQDFLESIKVAGAPPIPILAGILPLTSYRNAEYLNNEVPGITVPPVILERMRKADAGDAARAEGLKIAQEMLQQVRGMVEGVQISPPFGRYAMAVEVAQVLKKNAGMEVVG
jgi:methionine synthase I (cobalamin-dependent)/5,10-methylenetetrahydrofolate reductase